MTIQIDVAEVSPALVDDLANNGGEITLTRDGKPVAKLVRVDDEEHDNGPLAGSILYQGDLISPVAFESGDASADDQRVPYEGRWMTPASAERERSIEHLRGSGRILGDIVSSIDDVEWDTFE
jgi:antitoxin (DNA-binding transcriptional repressor) of toxin-antitoxin stability system